MPQDPERARTFYERLGWVRWRGPTYVQMPDGVVKRTAEDDGGLMVDAAEAIADLRKQLAAADARVKVLEAELIANRALTRETVA